MYFHMAHPASTQHFSRFGQCEFLEIDGEELNISSLQVRLVESPTREALLHRRAHWTASGAGEQIDATTLLSDLNRLASSLAKDIISKDLVDNAFPLRLVNDLDYQSEDEGYVALSYCWKRAASNTPRRVVTPVGDLPFGWTKAIEQFPLPTSPAVFQAILQERQPGEGLWYDQVSINQEDEVEKAATMGAIDTIYRNARTVVVPLDDVLFATEEKRFLRYYVDMFHQFTSFSDQQPHTGMSPPFMHRNTIFRSCYERILSSEWFDRAWCAHEMRMGQSLVFLVPCFSHYEDRASPIFRFTGTFLQHMTVLASELSDLAPALRLRSQSLLSVLQQDAQRNRGDALAVQCHDPTLAVVSDGRPPISSIVETFRLKANGNPSLPEHLRQLDANRDKTCIALNASGLPLAMTPRNAFSRPDIEDECLRLLILVALAARDPSSLCTTGPPLELHDGSISWLCRPTSLDIHPHRSNPPRFSKLASTIVQATDGRAEYAQLDLVFLDLPHRSQPNPLFPSLVTRARRFIDLCMQYQIPGSGLWRFSQSSNHPRTLTLRNCFIQTLSCIFDCGAQWLLDVTSNLHQLDNPTLDAYTVEVLLSPHLIVENYILLEEGQSALSQLLTFISNAIASGIPWASGASECTHGPLIVSAPTPSWSRDYPDNPSFGSSGRAVVFAPFEHSRTLLIAVPNAVKDTVYDDLARGWILTSMNPFTGGPKPIVSWTLQSKGVVFGDERFRALLEGCGEEDVRNHRVYGPSTR